MGESVWVGNTASWCPLGAPTCLVEAGTSEECQTLGPRLACLGWASPTSATPRSPIPSTQGGSTRVLHPTAGYIHPLPTTLTHGLTFPKLLSHPTTHPKPPRFPPAPNLASHYCRAPSPEQGTPPAPLPPAAAASPLRYCQRVASASVCEINSEVERENYVKCGYSGAAGEVRLMAKCLFVCLICIFFQRCIFRRVICCLFRPRSVSFLRQ